MPRSASPPKGIKRWALCKSVQCAGREVTGRKKKAGVIRKIRGAKLTPLNPQSGVYVLSGKCVVCKHAASRILLRTARK